MTQILRQTPRFAAPTKGAIPVHIVTPTGLEACLATLSEGAAQWAHTHGFTAKAGALLPLPDAQGGIAAVLIGYGTPAERQRGRFWGATAASALPKGTYAVASAEGVDLAEFALGWLLDGYRFDRYKSQRPAEAALVLPDGVNGTEVERIAAAECLARDLINTPAADMGPDALEAAAQALADMHGGTLTVTKGEALLDQNFPLIHAVGRAAEKAPRLLDLTWGQGPLLTLVGKGVCFDTGGLNLKPGASMGLMKKDMGGAANVLALAHAIMDAGWAVRLRVLIPAVENNVAGNAFRPGDVLATRKGLTVENTNTDAEGRLVLADALTLAAEEGPAQIVSMATLTGAARVALGPDVVPFYTSDDALALRLAEQARMQHDPIWRMPLHDAYEPELEPQIADLDNAPFKGFAGSITAALFLRRFAPDQAYAHFDVYGWQPSAKPARPKGGVGQAWRTLYATLPEALGL